jgi:hypothetical protein
MLSASLCDAGLVDSNKFVEMFSGAVSILWIDSKGKWIKCLRENMITAVAAEVATIAVLEKWQMLLVLNAVSKHRCPSSRMGPGRYTAANAIRSIDLPDRRVDTNPSIFLNDLFIRGQHPSIAGTLNEGVMLHALAIFCSDGRKHECWTCNK